MYFKTKSFQNNTSAVNSALENYNKLQSLIQSEPDSGSDDGGESAPVVLTEAPAAIEETIVEDDLAHVLEPTSQQKNSEINIEEEDLDKTLPIDEVVEDETTPSNLVEDKLADSIIEDTHLDDDSDAHLVHQKLHENILETAAEEDEKTVTVDEKLHENIVEETILEDDADAHLVHQKLHDDILDKAEVNDESSNVEENLHKDIVASV